MSELTVDLPEISAKLDSEFENRAALFNALRFGEPAAWPKPKVIGRLANQARFSQKIMERVGAIDIPPFIEDAEARTVTYELPNGYEQLEEAVRIIAAHEHTTYPSDYRPSPTQIKLIFDQRIVEPGKTHRGAGIHADGHIGRWQHIYLVSSTSPTHFFWSDEPMVIERDRMGQGDIIRGDLEGPYIPQDYEVVMANTTTPHASPIVGQGGPRSFLRVIYEHSIS